MKKVVEKEVKEERKEFDLEEAFVLWRNETKSKKHILKGYTSEALGRAALVGFYNTNKKNPKEPDIRVCLVEDNKAGKEVASLWENVSPKEVRYLTGVTDEKEKLVCFYGDEHKEARPYIRAYFRKEID